MKLLLTERGKYQRSEHKLIECLCVKDRERERKTKKRQDSNKNQEGKRGHHN
jgi:hypothetical protein